MGMLQTITRGKSKTTFTGFGLFFSRGITLTAPLGSINLTYQTPAYNSSIVFSTWLVSGGYIYTSTIPQSECGSINHFLIRKTKTRGIFLTDLTKC